MKKTARILVVDDEADARELTKDILSAEGHIVDIAESGHEGLQKLTRGGFDLVLLDLVMPEMNGLEVLKRIKQMSEADDVFIVMLTAYASVESAVEAMKLGAHDYISRPTDIEELRLKVSRAIEALTLNRQNVYLRGELEKELGFQHMVAKSPPMLEVFRTIQKVADTDTTVLIQGETGTGKELVARAIHASSERAAQPFVVVDCATLPTQLAEAELFGYEPGAFTDASRTGKPGKFEIADCGMLFLDEIGELDIDIQAKLLRILQFKEIVRLGGTKTKKINVRVIAASHRDLKQAVAKQQFKEALYHRLNVVPISLPPLRERKEDIPLLINHFLNKYNKQVKRNVQSVSQETAELLLRYEYPGNVRELENIIERAVILTEDDVILPAVLPAELCQDPIAESLYRAVSRKFSEAKEQFEREYIESLLKETKGNISEAARRAGMDRKNFRDKMRKYDIGTEKFR